MSEIPPPATFYRADYVADESVGWLMRKLVQSIVSQADRKLAVHGLTNAQWAPLFKLHQGQCTTVAELARELGLDPGATTRAIDRLEAKQLVRRIRSAEDRRVVRIELSDAGREAAAQVPAVLAEILNQHLSGFDAAEWRQLLDMLRRMLANGEANRGP
jgi:DNA-binding MarR family transcriptional regulator